MGQFCLSPARTLSHLAQRRGASTALVHRGAAISYEELDRHARRLSCALVSSGVTRGDRVAYAGLNSPLLIATMFAAMRLGAVFVPLNSRLATAEAASVLRNCGAAALVAEAGNRLAADGERSQLPPKLAVLVDGGSADQAAEADAPDPEFCAEGDLALLLYTSGSTGRPKGVMLTHGNVWWNNVNVQSMLDVRVGDTTLAVAPFFHIGGLNALTIGTLMRGGRVVVHRTFDARQCLADLAAYGVGGMFGVPTMYEAMARLPEFARTELPELRAAVVAGAPVPPRLITTYAERGVLLQQAWGLTETAPFATCLPREDTVRKAGSAGVAMTYTQVRVADRAGREVVEPGVCGELWVKGPNVTPGYWNDLGSTWSAITRDGWFRTGDIGYRDEDGYFHIADRIKDVIIKAGENIYSAEVEHVLRDIPGVIEAAVVGIPHPRWGETVAAALAVEPDASVTLRDVRDFASRRLAGYKVPTTVRCLADIPRNGSGKADKPSLRRLFQATASAAAVSPGKQGDPAAVPQAAAEGHARAS